MRFQAKSCYRKKPQQRIGRERKPLGPPAKPGNCAAYDIFTAILEDRPYPVKALLNFGSNTVMSTGDSLAGAAEAFRALDFAVAAELFMTPTAELCDYALPATSFLETSNLSNDFKHRQHRAGFTCSIGRLWSSRWRSGAPIPGWFSSWRNGSAWAKNSGKAISTKATNTSWRPTGISLGAGQGFGPGGITVSTSPRYEKFANGGQKRQRRAVSIRRIRKWRFILTSFAAHGFAPLPEYVEPMISPMSRPDIAEEYPLVLTNAKFTTYIHSQLRGLPSLRKAAPHPSADIHPQTAARYGIADKAWMIIESPRGSIRAKGSRYRRLSGRV